MTKRDKLAAAIHYAVNVEWSEKPFQWGKSDCLLALADILNRALGYDPASPFRGRYKTALGAARITKEYGGFAGALEWQAKNHRWLEISPIDGKVGDIGLVLNAKGPRCGVICYGNFWVGRSPGTGIAAIESNYVVKAWRVT